jgi:hypothetical protein
MPCKNLSHCYNNDTARSAPVLPFYRTASIEQFRFFYEPIKTASFEFSIPQGILSTGQQVFRSKPGGMVSNSPSSPVCSCGASLHIFVEHISRTIKPDNSLAPRVRRPTAHAWLFVASVDYILSITVRKYATCTRYSTVSAPSTHA